MDILSTCNLVFRIDTYRIPNIFASNTHSFIYNHYEKLIKNIFCDSYRCGYWMFNIGTVILYLLTHLLNWSKCIFKAYIKEKLDRHKKMVTDYSCHRSYHISCDNKELQYYRFNFAHWKPALIRISSIQWRYNLSLIHISEPTRPERSGCGRVRV